MAVDLGAGSGRCVVGQIVDGRWQLIEAGRFRTPAYTDTATGYQCWDTDAILRAVEQHLGQASAQARLASVGVDGWGVDYVLLDGDLQRVGAAVCYRDKRTAGVMERVHGRVPREDIYRRTGIQFLPFNTFYQLAACVEQRPEWLDAARHLLMIPDYLHFRLSGVAANEYTNATTTQICGLDGEWDDALVEAIGLKHELLRKPVAAGTVLGEGQGAASGMKVIAPATHDTASAVAGTPLESDDEAYISSGTWSLMGIESRTPMATADALRMNFTNEGGLEGRFRVLKNIMGMWPMQRICEEQGIADIDALVKEAGDAAPWRSILDTNDPEFLNPPSMTEAIRTFCRSTQQPAPETAAQMARCIFDSLALSYRQVKEQLEALRGRRLVRMRIVGGGCRNRLLNQLCADACGLPVLAGPVEASALGNLSAQMIALGEMENLQAARAVIRASFVVEEYTPRAGVPVHVLECWNELRAAREAKGATCA
ncbi:MAG TPA: rhamnulokinase [Terracidiphilus sp.]|nr:rhamnulokinase [Terracidiphilus sp.]